MKVISHHLEVSHPGPQNLPRQSAYGWIEDEINLDIDHVSRKMDGWMRNHAD
jgi:hypothetical protein